MQHLPLAAGTKPRIVQARNSRFGDRAFLCWNNRRHLIPNASLLAAYDLRWPDDLVQVDEGDLVAMRPAQILPRIWTEADYRNPPAGVTSRQMREIAGSQLAGIGLELGALASPFPVPLHCNVLYGDTFNYQQIVANYQDEPIDEIVIPMVITELETLTGIADESLDFIIASHVIEHTRDPIGAIITAHKKLRPGGKLLLVVPDKQRTFDRDRELTTLEHLIEDYRSPSHERDKAHHIEYFEVEFSKPPPEAKAGWRHTWETRYPIHYHTWIYESFAEMLDWITANGALFSSRWSHPTLPREVDDFEFYFILTKKP